MTIWLIIEKSNLKQVRLAELGMPGRGAEFFHTSITTSKNQPWWPSGLERVSNSSRHSLEDPGLNPARDC